MIWGKQILIIAVLWCVVFLTYSNSFTISFQFDDTHTVQSNLYIRSLKFIPYYFTDAKTYSSRPENSGYRPMTTLALALGFALSDLRPWGYHLIKLIEHAVVAGLIFLVLETLLTGVVASTLISFFSALIFAAHPANTETVNYISAISSLQAGMFFILAFFLYLAWRKDPKYWKLGLSALSYLCAVLSKEEGITLPAVLILYECFFQKTSLKEIFKKCVPYLVIALLFVILRTVIQPAEAEASRGNVPRFIYFITQLRSWLYYWSLFFWPRNLNADNLGFEFSTGLDDWRVWGALLVHASIWALAFQQRNRRPFVSFCISAMYITILPASSIFPLVEAVNEHRMFIAYMFLSSLVVWGLFQVPLKHLTTVVCCAVSTIFSYTAYARNMVWQTPISLWTDVLEKNPNSPRAMNVLGVSYVDKGEYEKATPILERCHVLVPNYLPCIVHLGLCYAHAKRFNEGLAILLDGHKLDPNYPHLNYHLGVYYKEYFRNFEKARELFSLVLNRTQGRLFQAAVKIAEMDMEEGHIEQAMHTVESIIALDRGNAESWELYAKGLMLLGRFSEAKAIFEKLFAVSPDSNRYLLNLANLEERKENFREAIKFYQSITATRAGSNMLQAWDGVARTADKLHENEKASAARKIASDLKASGEYEIIPSMFLR